MREPAWKLRPPFVRGPQDRLPRGRSRSFLFGGDGVGYQNYAETRYIAYDKGVTSFNEVKATGRPLITRNVRWDRLGNYMGSGYQRIMTFEESRSGSDFSGYSYIDHRRLTFLIGHYTYKSLHWTATVGNGVTGSYVRTIFTPLTLTNSLHNVARLDLNYRERDRATLFYARGGQQGATQLFSEWASGEGNDAWDGSPVLQYGGHWQRSLGDYASFGATLVNQVMQQPASSRADPWRGDLPYQMLAPHTIRVFVADDSPEEAARDAVVYDVDILLEGERDGQTVRLTSLDGDADHDPSLEAAAQGGTPRADGGRRASGDDPVTFTFRLPADVTTRSVRFVADVAGDYRIGVRQTHEFFQVDRRGNASLEPMQWPASFNSSEAPNRRVHKWYVGSDVEPYYTLVRSSGRSDGANRKLVTFDYGLPTGQSLASVNGRAELVGLQVDGEVAHNMRHLMFPVGNNEGQRSAQRAWAWWLKGVRDLPFGLAVGGEIYRMEPDYAGGYDSYRGGMAFHVDQQDGPGGRVESVTQEFPLHEDNDDHDRFPDEHSNDSATAQPRELYPGFPNAQVYPGLDENSDNIPDVDRNENFIVDWEEPFLTYDSEPPEFSYGIDFNNNSVPDYRENDDKPDYPYPRDQRGRHLFVRLERLGPYGDALSLGHFVSRQIVGGGRSRATYARYGFERRRLGTGHVRVDIDLKRVRDNIADHTFIYQVPPDDLEAINWLNKPDGPPERAGFVRPATPDELRMRDSVVLTSFVDTEWQAPRDVRLSNSLLWFRNDQARIDDPVAPQTADVHTRFAVVNKADVTWTHRALRLTPKFKHRTIYEAFDNDQQARTSYSDFIPIVSAELRLTPRTSLQAGAQGLPLLPYRRWDRVNKDATWSQTDYLCMLHITSEYFGIRDNSIYVGYQRTRRDFDRPQRPDQAQSVLFVELISPF